MARTSSGTFGLNRIFFTEGLLLAVVLTDLIHSEAALADYLFKGKAAVRVLPEVVTRGGDGATVFFGEFLVIVIAHHHFE